MNLEQNLEQHCCGSRNEIFPSTLTIPRGNALSSLCILFNTLLVGLLFIASSTAWANQNHALLIGISRYSAQSGATPLPGVPHDLLSAKRIASALGIPAANIEELRDEVATKQAIMIAIGRLTSRVAEGGRALIYFSGHGTRWFDPAAKGCVEGLYSYDGKVIVNRELAEVAKALGDKADKLIVMFDACHSEGVTSAGRTRSISEELTPKFFVRAGDSAEICSRPSNMRTRSLFGEAKGVGIQAENIIHISSSRPDEVSFDEPGKGGLATQGIRDCMFGKARDLDNSGGISLAEIEHCARAQVRSRLEGHPHLLPHHPTIVGQRNLLAVNQQRQAEEQRARQQEEARLAAEREAQRREEERLARERLQRETEARRRAELNRIAEERARAEAARQQELASQRAEELRLEQEKLAQSARQERERQQALERARQQEREAHAKREQERLESERAEADRLARLRAQEEALAKEEAEKARLAEERKRQEDEARRLANLAREHAERLAVEAALAVDADKQTQGSSGAESPLGPLATLNDVLNQRDPRRKVDLRLKQRRLKIDRDELAMVITPQRDGYLYLIHVAPDLQTFTLLFPNALQSDNRVRARQPVQIPRLDWRLVSAGPPGVSKVLALVSDTPKDTKLLPPVKTSEPFSQVITDADGRRRLIDFAAGDTGAFGAELVEVEEVR